MKSKFFSFGFGLFLITGFFASCSNSVEPDTYVNIKKHQEKVIDIIYQFYSPKDSTETVFWDDFEGTELTYKNQWSSTNASLTTLSDVRNDLVSQNSSYEVYYNSLFGGAESKIAKLDANYNTTSNLTYSNLNLSEDCYLTFRYFFVGVDGSTFKIILDNEKEVFSVNGVSNSKCFNISTKSVQIPTGTKSITFRAQNNTGSEYIYWPNGAFIDDISLVYDRTTSVIVTPRSTQKTYVGCPEKEQIRVEAFALRTDGTIMEGKTISMSSSNGTIDSKGYFNPSKTGSTKVNAICDGVSGESGEITIYESCFEAGSSVVGGINYQGTKTDIGESLSNQTKTYPNYDGKIDFEYPKTDKVTADGFVRIKGKLTPSSKEYSEFNRVFIIVSAGEGEAIKQTIYECDRDFDLRVWLPFSGEHTIKVYTSKLIHDSYYDENGKLCEGDLKSYECMTTYTIKASNTHDNGSNIRRNIYPSGLCQADSFIVQNFTNEALYGLSDSATAEEKFTAIHDYVVLNLYYDDASISTGNTRKKQDALSVVKNRTAVCEGYSNLIAAMCRYAGIPANVVISNQMCHAWNYIFIDGKQLFCDVTWDDPDKDPYSTKISYNYFLLNDYNGQNNDHYATDKYIDSRYIGTENAKCCELSEFYKHGYYF